MSIFAVLLRSYCPASAAEPMSCSGRAGTYCPAESRTNGVVCPASHFCTGAMAQPIKCTGPEGTYCPPGSPSKNAAPCPEGAYCTGGTAQPVCETCNFSFTRTRTQRNCIDKACTVHAKVLLSNRVCFRACVDPCDGRGCSMLLSADTLCANQVKFISPCVCLYVFA